ncbi:MAG: hypothetical protein U0992_06245 [Planctomycetaceae bacterium]
MHLRARRWLLLAAGEIEQRCRTGGREKSAGQGAPVSHKVIIWNTHNGAHMDRGTVTCNVQFVLGGNVVLEKQNTLPWLGDAPSPTVIRPAAAIRSCQVEVLTYHRNGGGLAEVRGASGALTFVSRSAARASSVYSGDFQANNVTDGNFGDKLNQKGIWLLPDREPGWIEIQLNRQR